MRKSTKITAAIGGASLALATAGAAYAYWTSNGSGTGTASTKTPAANQLSVDSYTSPSNMAPGVAAGAITVTVKNNDTNNTMAQQVVVSITSVTGPNISVATPCGASDYTLTGATMTTGATDLAAGATTTFSGASLGFNNTASNQDGCKGATVNLGFALS